jgi:predicted nucleic acid-binding protein
MKKRVYIETTIPSFVFEPRLEPEMVARRTWTTAWWNEQRHHFELLTSAAVLEELERGLHPEKRAALDLIAELPLLAIENEVYEIVDAYVRHQVMPQDPRGDALHLALASYHNCHFLLTWNCAHLANANKFEHIRHVNALLGLFVPALVTPVELMHWEGDLQ